MKFPKQILQDLSWGDHDGSFSIIYNKIIDQGRWTAKYEQVFRFNDKFYKTTYHKGSTEMQDSRPYEYEKDEIECIEVFPVEKTITVYEPKDKQ